MASQMANELTITISLIEYMQLCNIRKKYQQIEQILHCHNRYTDDAAECIENLRKVVEDGKID